MQNTRIITQLGSTSIIELIVMLLIKIVFILISVAYYTIAERKVMAAIQRRRGPNVVGFMGLLQPLADGLKLAVKEFVVPSHANGNLFIFAPIGILTVSFLNWTILPFAVFFEEDNKRLLLERAYSFIFSIGPTETRFGLLVTLMLSSFSVYGIIIAGWSSNSKYAFLGALRSAAQMISYEVAISLTLLPVIVLTGSLSFADIVLTQAATVWFVIPLLPSALIFFIAMIAETNRTPFDLPEAEAELVAGYNIEYSSIVFAMFFLAEYNNMIIMSFIISLLFFGGWTLSTSILILSSPTILVLKGLVFCFLFILVRATLPRYRYDQLMDTGWKILLPIATALFVLTAGLVLILDCAPIVEQVPTVQLASLFVETLGWTHTVSTEFGLETFFYWFGLIGAIFSTSNFLLSMLNFELMYIGIISAFISLALTQSMLFALICAILIIVIAACESSVGLGILVVCYRGLGRIDFNTFQELAG